MFEALNKYNNQDIKIKMRKPIMNSIVYSNFGAKNDFSRKSNQNVFRYKPNHHIMDVRI